MCKSGIPLKDVKSSEWNYSGIYKITNCVPSINSAFLRTGADYRSISQICNNHNYRQGGRTISRKRYLFSFSQEELEDRVKHYFENDRFQQKNQKF